MWFDKRMLARFVLRQFGLTALFVLLCVSVPTLAAGAAWWAGAPVGWFLVGGLWGVGVTAWVGYVVRAVTADASSGM